MCSPIEWKEIAKRSLEQTFGSIIMNPVVRLSVEFPNLSENK